MAGSAEDEESKEDQKNVKKRKLNEEANHLYTVPNNTPLTSTDLKIPDITNTRQVNTERL